jgi:hypothetical protein
MWTVLVWLTTLLPGWKAVDMVAGDSALRPYLAMLPPMGYAWVVASFYSAYYVLLEPFAGVSSSRHYILSS